MNQSEIETVEIGLILEAIYRRSGYDFRSYAPASIERGIRRFLAGSGCGRISEMIPPLLYDEEFLARLLQKLSVPVSEIFRDPFVYRAIREKVIPSLRNRPFFKVWDAGCATGEEAYSLAIVLREEGLYDRATIYASDFNDDLLRQAEEGILPLDKMKVATLNYQRAGGRGSFSEYYHASYQAAVIDGSLKTRITFINHNLVTDGAFGEMELVLCRNVLIYFDRSLQNRVLELITESLAPGGFLCLGTKESLRFSTVADAYEPVDEEAKIYRKKGAP